MFRGALVFFIILSSALTPEVFGQDLIDLRTLVLDKGTTAEVHENNLFVYRPEDPQVDISHIQSLKPNDFLPLSQIRFSKKEQVYWVYFKIRNREAEPLDYILTGGLNTKETYYLVQKDKITTYKAGSGFPPNERSIWRGIRNCIRFQLEPDYTTHVYVKIDNEGRLPYQIQAKLEPAETWRNTNELLNLFHGVFGALMIIVFLANLILFTSTKQKINLYFALYSVTNLLAFLFYDGYLEIIVSPYQANTLDFLYFTPWLSGYFYFKIISHFKGVLRRNRLFKRVIITLAGLCLSFFVLNTAYLFLFNDLWSPVLISHYGFLGVAMAALVLVFFLYEEKDTLTRFFSLGTFFMLTAILLSVFHFFIFKTPQTPLWIEIGIILELLIFGVGLMLKLKSDYEDHGITLNSLILELRNNEHRQKQINRELMEQVAERTLYINQQNRALTKAKKEAEAATLAKSEFLSVMSHEIRTPLNAIISLSQIMDMDNKSEEMQEYIDALKFSAEGLYSLINDVLDYNKIEAHKLKLEQLPFSLIDLLKKTTKSFQYKTDNSEVQITLEISEHLPSRVLGDPTRLSQVLNNLLGNAIKFTRQGEVKIMVKVESFQDEMANIYFEVQDSGIGIPKDKLEIIFNAYEQAGEETTREYGGTGLGLSITQKLLQLMGTEIHVDSQVSVGTKLSFTLSFPIDESFDMVTDPETNYQNPLKGVKILVVDDNAMNRMVLKRLHKLWQADFYEADHKEKALKLCQQETFDLILMDIHLPPHNGSDIAKEIHELSIINKGTPIIAMSAHFDEGKSNLVDMEHFIAFVRKPFDPQGLQKSISDIFRNTSEVN